MASSPGPSYAEVAGAAPCTSSNSVSEPEPAPTPTRAGTTTPATPGPPASAKWQTYMVTGHRFDLPARFRPREILGQGAFGFVCSAEEEETRASLSVAPPPASPGQQARGRRSVAIKRIGDAFETRVQARRVWIEVQLLRRGGHRSLLSLRAVLVSQSGRDVYLVTPLAQTDLQQLLCRQDGGPSAEDGRGLFRQLLSAVAHLHARGILHRDLKPSNVLVDLDPLRARVCDFGMAVVGHSVAQEYPVGERDAALLATLWYRAPELLLSSPSYSAAADLWACGCILAEVLTREPLFPGHEPAEQLDLILQRLPCPPGLRARHPELAAVAPPSRPLFSRGLSDQAGLDLVVRLTQLDPRARPPASAALAHAYLGPGPADGDGGGGGGGGDGIESIESPPETLADLRQAVVAQAAQAPRHRSSFSLAGLPHIASALSAEGEGGDGGEDELSEPGASRPASPRLGQFPASPPMIHAPRLRPPASPARPSPLFPHRPLAAAAPPQTPPRPGAAYGADHAARPGATGQAHLHVHGDGTPGSRPTSPRLARDRSFSFGSSSSAHSF